MRSSARHELARRALNAADSVAAYTTSLDMPPVGGYPGPLPENGMQGQPVLGALTHQPFGLESDAALRARMRSFGPPITSKIVLHRRERARDETPWGRGPRAPIVAEALPEMGGVILMGNSTSSESVILRHIAGPMGRLLKEDGDERSPLVYARPSPTADERVFFDLVAYAPGMNTDRADI